MTIDPVSGRIAFPEIGFLVEPSLTRGQFLRLRVSAACKAGVHHDPWFRYQLPVLPQRDTELYVVLQFQGERLASLSLFHSAERFGHAWQDGSEAHELARKAFHEQWLAAQFGLTCRRYPWGRILSLYDAKAGSSSLMIEYANPNAWQIAGRTAGRLWGAASSRR